MVEMKCVTEMKREREVATICRDALVAKRDNMTVGPESDAIRRAISEYDMTLAIIDRLIRTCSVF